MKRSLYLAAGLFNVAERQRNARLASHMKKRGWNVALPQRLALHFFEDGKLNLRELAIDCKREAADPENICVVCLDGPDADSGAATEYAFAQMANERVITYRTDFRTVVEQELGVNGMFHLPGTTFIYMPCYAVELAEFELYYEQLADSIHEAAIVLENR